MLMDTRTSGLRILRLRLLRLCTRNLVKTLATAETLSLSVTIHHLAVLKLTAHDAAPMEDTYSQQ